MIDDRVERKMKRLLIDYDYVPELDLADVAAPGPTSATQNREHDHPRDVIEVYAAAYKRGDELPAIVLWAGPGERPPYTIVDGHGRFAALTLNKADAVDAYVIRCSADQRDELALVCNNTHGRPPATAWMLRQAVELTLRGWSTVRAAAEANVPKQALERQLRLRSGEQRAERLHITSVWRSPLLTDTQRDTLAAVADDSVFEDVANIAAAIGLTNDETRRLTRGAAALGSEAERRAYVADQRETMQVKSSASRGSGPRTTGPSRAKLLALNLARLNNFHVKAAWLEADTDLRVELQQLTAQVIARLQDHD